MYLNEQRKMKVVAEAHDGHELIKRTESTCPHLVLLDWDLIDRATPVLINAIYALDQEIIIVIISSKSDNQKAALDAGADAFVKLGDPPDYLMDTISRLIPQNKLTQ